MHDVVRASTQLSIKIVRMPHSVKKITIEQVYVDIVNLFLSFMNSRLYSKTFVIALLIKIYFTQRSSMNKPRIFPKSLN